MFSTAVMGRLGEELVKASGRASGKQEFVVDGGVGAHHATRSMKILIGLGILLQSSGCGECVFSGTVSGTVTNQDGMPLASVTVKACAEGDGCSANASDGGCTSTTTDANGKYALEVQQCRPAPLECELRPVNFLKDSCGDETKQIGFNEGVRATMDAQLRCDPS